MTQQSRTGGSSARSTAARTPGAQKPAAVQAKKPTKQATGSKTKSQQAGSAGRSKANSSRTSSASRSNNGSQGYITERSLPAVKGIKVKSRSQSRRAEPRSTPPPTWWKKIQKELPPYADELLAFLLIGIGLLTFLTLLSPESGEIGTAWSGILRQLFGVGAFIVAAAILGAGAMLLVPKLGIPVRMNWLRLALGEVVFVLVLATIHTMTRAGQPGEAGSIEAFAQATEGRGGGLVGWALQDLLHMLLGDVVTGIVLLTLLAIASGVMFGVQRPHIIAVLDRAQAWFLGLAGRLEPLPGSPVMATEPVIVQPPLAATASPAPELTEVDEDDPDEPGEIEIELPPIPGRPSIVTGERGSGVVVTVRTGTPPAANPLSGQSSAEDLPVSSRIERLKAKHKDRLQDLEMRFKVDDVIDRRRSRRRSEKLPPLDLLEDRGFERPSDEEVNISAAIIESAVADFGMAVRVIGVKAGPTVTQYAVSPYTQAKDKGGNTVTQRVRVTRITNLSKDIALALAAPSVRIQAPVPGTRYVGIEVPNIQPGIVSLRPVMESEQYYQIKGPLGLALGREVDGRPYAADLGKMPHLLIGGTTGSGKSVCLRSIATCLVTNNPPNDLKLIMLDPKMVELVRFNGLPHLLGHVEVQVDRIIGVLRWVTREMDRRYRLMEEAQARNVDVFNHGRHYKYRLPRLVVLIDELAELMMEAPDETEHLITRLAQMARATGIHLVVATQRPSTDVVTGLIKANFPARISFTVASGVDSRVVLDSVGAEDLIGKGDMLYQSPEAAAPVRLQGCFVSDREMERLVDYWRDAWEEDELDDDQAPWERSLTRAAIIEETDEMLLQAIRVVQQDREASASALQRKLNVGYPRAGRIIDLLYDLGVVGPEQTGGRTREVLIQPYDDPLDYIIRQKGR